MLLLRGKEGESRMNTMTQHTRGPWRVVNNRFTNTPTCIGAGDFGAIADTAGFRGVPAEDHANARLIAKAPEMYDLLIAMLTDGDDLPMTKRFRALLRDIEGGV